MKMIKMINKIIKSRQI